MIGDTGMVDNFDVSLSSKLHQEENAFLPDEVRTERNVEVIYHSCLTNHVVEKYKNESGQWKERFTAFVFCDL